MAKVPIFSVIIPTYNRANLLEIAIKSVLEQEFSNFELIVVDDGSEDHTRQVVNAFEDSRIQYHYQKNQERSTARNNGIHFAKAKYICFLDDDDYYLPNYLSTFYDELSKEDFPDIILRTGFIQMENDQEIGKSDSFDLDAGINPTEFCAYHFCAVYTLCIPKVFLLEHDFPVAFRHWQDTHLILRLLALYPFRQLDAYTYAYIQHSKMGSRSIYHFPDAHERIQSNVDAMFDVFEHHSDLISPHLPKDTLEHMVSLKYINHANGALMNGQIKLAISLILKSIKHNKKAWFLGLYAKFFLKIPTKILFGYPRPN